jgi:PPM family protein phosphatase
MVRFASHTHVGRVHHHNEDSIGSDPTHGRWLIADGMGGHASGEVASRIVRDTIMSRTDLPLAQAVQAAHVAVKTAGNAGDERYRGMGSTVVALALHAGEGEVVWVGDSRAYLWRRGALRPLSRDHSYVELLRDTTAITEAEVRAHPERNIVTQTLGLHDPAASSVQVQLRAGDWLMLCSDGLNDELDDVEIAAHLRRNRAPDGAVVGLVDAALAKGGRDNVSVVIVAIEQDDLPGRWRTLRSRSWFPALLGAISAIALGSLLLFWLK